MQAASTEKIVRQASDMQATGVASAPAEAPERALLLYLAIQANEVVGAAAQAVRMEVVRVKVSHSASRGPSH